MRERFELEALVEQLITEFRHLLIQLLVHLLGSILRARVEVEFLWWLLERHALACLCVLASGHHLLVVHTRNQSDPDLVSIGLNTVYEANIVFEDTRVSDSHPDIFRQLTVLCLV